MDRFEIERFWEDSASSVNAVFQSLPAKLKRYIAERIRFFEQRSVVELLKNKSLKKIRGYSRELYELRFYTNPPYRMLGIFIGGRYQPVHMFPKKSQKLSSRDIYAAIGRL